MYKHTNLASTVTIPFHQRTDDDSMPKVMDRLEYFHEIEGAQNAAKTLLRDSMKHFLELRTADACARREGNSIVASAEELKMSSSWCPGAETIRRSELTS
jgi:hypothetical protein